MSSSSWLSWSSSSSSYRVESESSYFSFGWLKKRSGGLWIFSLGSSLLWLGLMMVAVEQWLDSCEYLWTFLSKLYATAGDLNWDSLKQLAFFGKEKHSFKERECANVTCDSCQASFIFPFVVFNCSWFLGEKSREGNVAT